MQGNEARAARCGNRPPYAQEVRLHRLPVFLADRYAARADARRRRHVPRRVALNMGTGGVDLDDWINLDETKPGDLLARVPPIPVRSSSVDEIMLSHVLEHLPFYAGVELLRECRRVLMDDGEVTVIVPDMRAVHLAHVTGQISNRHLNDFFVHSYMQESHHRWSYDWPTLRDVLRENGFPHVRRINRFHDPRLFASAWFQVACVASPTRRGRAN